MKDLKPFAITPTSGGVIKVENVVCRDEVISHYWKILEIKGISLFAERRFGKSSIIRKMAENPPDGFIALYKSTQSINNIEDFVEQLLQVAKENELLGKLNVDTLEKFWNTITDAIPEAWVVKLGKLNHVWQKKLSYLVSTVLKNNKGKILVLFLDEFSLMLDAMKPEDSASLIGFLRDMVHEEFSERLRFVYTGSISIELILDKVKRQGYNLGDPLNHTEKERLKPFDKEQTLFFCECLELGCNINLSKNARIEIHYLTGGIPYFIDKIFDKIRYKQNISKKDIETALEDIINDPNDKSNLAYYYDRIEDYYPKAILSYIILKILCKEENIEEKGIIDVVLKQHVSEEHEIQNEINRLWSDGYLKREIVNGQRHYSFQYAILKRWWIINKG